MNVASPRDITAFGIAAGISGKPRAKQDVHIVTKTHGGGLPARVIVSVSGKYYEVSEQTLGHLQGGSTPEYLELEECELPDDADEYPDRAASNADRQYQMERETF